MIPMGVAGLLLLIAWVVHIRCRGGRTRAIVSISCVAGMILCCLAPWIFGPAVNGRYNELPGMEAAAGVGQALRGVVKPNARVVLLRPDLPGAAAQDAAWEQAIEQGAGVPLNFIAAAAPVMKVGHATMRDPGDAAAFSAALDKYPNIDAWVSLVSIPRGFEAVSTHKRDPRPAVVAYAGELAIEPEVAAGYLERGSLTALIVIEDGRLKCYAEANVQELRDKSSAQ